MAKNYELVKQLGYIGKNKKNGWGKAVLRLKWFDNAPTIDIRTVQEENEFIGKGVSMTNEETDRLVDLLLENDYGSVEALEKALKKKRNLYTIDDEDPIVDKYVIDVKVDD